MLGVDSKEAPTHELADRCRDVRERLIAIAKLIATLRAEIEQALSEPVPSSRDQQKGPAGQKDQEAP